VPGAASGSQPGAPVPPTPGGHRPRPDITAYPSATSRWAAVPSVSGSSTEPISGIPAIGGARTAGPQWSDDPVQSISPFGAVRMPGPVSPVSARPVAPADGMNPADDAALHEMVRLLGNSLSMAGGPEEVAGRLRAALVQAQPALFAKLPGSPTVQAEQLAEALTWLVHNLDQPPLLVTACGRLGAALAECGVLPQHLQLTGAALAEAMRAGMAANGWRQDFDQAWRSTWQHAYEWIAHGMTSDAYQPAEWAAVVIGHELRRDDLAMLWLRPYLPMPYRPGQYARIEVPSLPGEWRPYSMTGAPRLNNVVELHVRAKSHSGVSGTLVYRTAVGDRVRITRAEGEMGLPESGRDLLMIAGDTGVVPLKALLTELAATGDPRSAVLFWGVRNLNELYDITEITEIARACRRATVVPVISEGEAGPYASGLVTDAVAAYGEWSGHEVYLAGPPLMLAATAAALQQLGVAPDRIHHDIPS
jgi:NAD(P)H-flavin reductase/hemoglobin-like flavoprotein